MKEKIKNILLIIWILISLKVITLTFGNVCAILIGSIWSFFNFLHLPFNFINDLVIYVSNWKPIKGDPTILPILRGFTDLLFFTFIINSWVLYFLIKKRFEFRPQNKITYIALFFLLFFYFVTICRDIIVDTFFSEVLSGLENHFFFPFLQVIIALSLIVTTMNTVCIFLFTNWSIFKKLILASLTLFIGFIGCGFVDTFIIYKEGVLYHTLTNPLFKETRSLSELLNTLISSYNFSISWCNPNQQIDPCKQYRILIEQTCFFPDTLQSFSLGGRSVGSNILGTFSPPAVEYV
jgi:hypothetical protein